MHLRLKNKQTKYQNKAEKNIHIKINIINKRNRKVLMHGQNLYKKYKLYSLDNYMKNKEFIKNGYKEYGIKSLIKELENDNGYHMRIHSTDNYAFFGDCDLCHQGVMDLKDHLMNLQICLLTSSTNIMVFTCSWMIFHIQLWNLNHGVVKRPNQKSIATYKLYQNDQGVWLSEKIILMI